RSLSWLGPWAAQVAEEITTRPVLRSMAMMDHVAHAWAGKSAERSRAHRSFFMDGLRMMRRPTRDMVRGSSGRCQSGGDDRGCLRPRASRPFRPRASTPRVGPSAPLETLREDPVQEAREGLLLLLPVAARAAGLDARRPETVHEVPDGEPLP